MRALLVLVLGIVPATACRYDGTYTCERNSQCRSAAAPGTCQLPAGLCSFPDPMCPTGQRYDDTAGSSAGACVEPAVMIDAPLVFDPATCPSTFMQLTADLPSRYRVLPALPATARIGDYMNACAMEKPGFTHAAIIETMAEGLAIGPLVVQGSGATQVFIGAIQDRAATTPGAGWIHADGSEVALEIWGTNQPDDLDGSENLAEQVGALFSGGTVNDTPVTSVRPILCECDGKAVSPAFTALVAANSN